MDDDSDDLIQKKKKGGQKKDNTKDTKGGKKKQDQPKQVQEQEHEPENKPNQNAAKQVLYCQICTLPPEFCELGKTFAECKAWLEKTDPELLAKLHPFKEEAPQEKVEELKQEQPQVQEQQGEEQKQQQEPPKKKKSVKVKEPQNVVKISVKQRMKDKFLTHIAGLEKFGIDLKEVQKKFSKKFGCGASVANNQIEIQGDFSYDLSEWLPKEYPQINEDMIDIKEL